MYYLQLALWLGGIMLSVFLLKLMLAWLFRPVTMRLGMTFTDAVGRAGESVGYATRWAVRTRWFSWAWYVSLIAGVAQGAWQGHTYTGDWWAGAQLVVLSWLVGAVVGGAIDGLLKMRRSRSRALVRRT